MSAEKFAKINNLINIGEIDVACALLRTIDDPKSDEWLQQIHEKLRDNEPESLGALIAEIPYQTRKQGFRLPFFLSLGVTLLIGGSGAMLLGVGMIAGLLTLFGILFIVIDILERVEYVLLGKLPPLQLRTGGLVITKGSTTHVLGWESTRFQFIQADEKPDRIRIFAGNGTRFEFSDEIRYKAGFIRHVERESALYKTKLIEELRQLKVEPSFRTQRGKEPEWQLYSMLMMIAVAIVCLSFLFEGAGSAKELLVRLAVTIPASHFLQTLFHWWDKRRRPYCYQIRSAGIDSTSKTKQRQVNWQNVSDVRVKRDKIRLTIADEPDFTVDIGSNYTGLLDGHVIREWTISEVRPIVVQHLIGQLMCGETIKFKRFSVTRYGIEGNTSISWRQVAQKGADNELEACGIEWKDDERNAIAIEPLIQHFTAEFEQRSLTKRVARPSNLS